MTQIRSTAPLAELKKTPVKTVKKEVLKAESKKKDDENYKLNLPVYLGSNPYIFVSYSHEDAMAIKPILARLTEEKYRIWYDDNMEVGEDFREELRDRIGRCSAFLLFISRHSMASKYCGMEIITAYKNDKKIYPVYLEDNVEIPPAFKMMLENMQHIRSEAVDEEGPMTENRYISKLMEGLPFATKRSLSSNNSVLTKCMDGSKEITIHDGLIAIGEGAFKDITSMETIKLGQDIQEIRREAFRGCRNLKEIDLPPKVRMVGDSAFRDCVSMQSLNVQCKEIEIGERAFENCAKLVEIELPREMTEIYGGVFNSCKALEKINLPVDLNVMGESCFADCAMLSEIVIPDKVSKIGDMVFNGCLNLSSITLPKGLAKIGKHAFKDCRKLASIQIPASVISIGSGAFRGCTKLREIEVDPKSRYFKSVDGILYNKNKSRLLAYPAMKIENAFRIPDSVTIVGDWALCESRNLLNVEIPDSVQEIGEGAFHMCTSIQEVIIPDSVTIIDDSAFRGCSSLKRITIPDSVREFGWGIFSGCDSNLVVICSDNSRAATYCNNLKIAHSES